MPATPCLDAWRDRLRREPESRHAYDNLWVAACWEQTALDTLAQGGGEHGVAGFLERALQELEKGAVA